MPEKDKQDLDQKSAMRLMLDHPSLIKRPVVEAGDRLLVGFDSARYRSLMQKS